MMNDKFAARHLEQAIERVLKASAIRSILVAVSGGADSVALLVACCRISRHHRLRIEAVNCNFHLRGEESNRDSEFTAGLCESLGVRLHTLNYDVETYISEHPGISTEMACRELRYRDFFRIAKEEEFDRVAVAHNSDDDIETMLINMLRGSGSRGLKGMDYDNGKVIRPLLGISRKDIELYLEAVGFGHITDSSNLTSEYRRNFIRLEVLPLLESRWPGARKSLSKTAGIMKEESDIIEKHYRELLSKLKVGEKALKVYSDGVTAGIVWRFLEPFGGNPTIADEIMEALQKPFTERVWILGNGNMAKLERDRLTVNENSVNDHEPTLRWTKINMSDEVMEMVMSNKSHDIIYLPNGENEYILRKPQEGDRIAPLGMKGTRLVSDIISDAKLSHEQKSEIRVLIRKSDGRIIWVTGLKRSRHDLIDKQTPIIYKASSDKILK